MNFSSLRPWPQEHVVTSGCVGDTCPLELASLLAISENKSGGRFRPATIETHINQCYLTWMNLKLGLAGLRGRERLALSRWSMWGQVMDGMTLTHRFLSWGSHNAKVAVAVSNDNCKRERRPAACERKTLRTPTQGWEGRICIWGAMEHCLMCSCVVTGIDWRIGCTAYIRFIGRFYNVWSIEINSRLNTQKKLYVKIQSSLYITLAFI